MPEARVLIDGKVIRSTQISDFFYSKYGFILGFKYRSEIYRHCLDVTRGIRSGYYKYTDYLNYMATYDVQKPVTLTPFDFPTKVFEAVANDEIIVKQRKISNGFENVCWYTYKFPFILGTDYREYDLIPVPSNAEVIGLPDCSHTTSGTNFYNSYITKAVTSNDVKFANVLADIQQLIDYIEYSVFQPPIISNNLYREVITGIRNSWDDSESYDFDKVEEYKMYFSRLSSFSTYFQSHLRLQTDEILGLLALTAVSTPICLKDIPFAIKLKMLERLAKEDQDNWQLFFYNPEDDESVVVKIFESITEEEADLFLDEIITPRLITPYNRKSLFTVFYYGVDNSNFGIGKDNLNKLMMAMYSIWASSKYNPYKNNVFSQSSLDLFTYNNEIATNPDPNNNWWDTVLGLEANKFNFNAAPIILNYVSTKAAGIYFDNFTFYFNYDPTFFGNELRRFDTRFGRSFINVKEVPVNGIKILAVKEDYKDNGDPGLYGTYDFYQPVMLVDSNQETALKIPVIDGDEQGTIDGSSVKISSLVPIFLLKYIDDYGDEKDFWTSVGIAVDVISILAGGYAAFTRIGHLRKLSRFSKSMIEGTEEVTETLFRMYLSAGANTINFSAASVSFFLKLTAEVYGDRPWYKKLLNIVIWIEVFSAGGSVLADKMLKNSAKRLVQEFNANGWPAEFVTDARGTDARNILEKTSGLAADLIPGDVKKILRILFKKEKPGKFLHYLNDLPPLHSDEDILRMINIAFEGGVSEYDIASIIHISYKKDKLIQTQQLFLQVRYHTYVTRVKGYPAGFISRQKYVDYSKAMEEFWIDTFNRLDTSFDTTFNGLKYELVTQGSVNRKRFSTDPLSPGHSGNDFIGIDKPGDKEYTLLMDDANYNKFLENFGDIANKFTGDLKSDLREAVRYARKNGNFSYYSFEKLEKGTLKKVNEIGMPHMNVDVGFEGIRFSIIKKGSRLDLGPSLPFLKQ